MTDPQAPPGPDSDLVSDAWRIAVRHAPYGVMVTDGDGAILWVNEAVCQISGYSERELIGSNPRMLKSGRHEIGFYEEMFASLEDEGIWLGEIWNRRKDGSVYAQSAVISRIERDDDVVFVAQFHDVSALHEAARRATSAEERLRHIFEAVSDGVFEWFADSPVLTVSERFVELLGRPVEGPTTSIEIASWYEAIVKSDREHFRERLESCAADLAARCAMTVRLLDAAGELRYWYVRGAADLRGDRVVVSGAVTDVTEEELIRRRFEYESLYDSLTGLPNRTSFRERLLHCLDAWRRAPDGGTFGVAILALDQYHMVVDGFGHETADRLIVAVATRLQAALGHEPMTLARFEQAHFALLAEGLPSPTSIHGRVNRIRQLLSEPFSVDGREIFASLSIGVALPDNREANADSLLRAADTALTRARRISGGSGYQIYDSYMQKRTLRRLTLGTELRYALERDEFSVAYQPIVRIEDGEIVGSEALIRWQHPELGVVSPSELVPIAEESGLVVPIDRWVLSRACADAARWNLGRRERPITVHVNFSAHQFAENDLIDCVVETMSRTGADVSMLHLEITESTLMQDTYRAVEVIRQFRAMGLRVALDDFGTGYSSLSYLHLFPLDYLKIDRMFVSQLEAGGRDRKFVKVMLDLAETMQLVPIAEGVETVAQRETLRELGCRFAQGYLYSKPVAGSEIDELLRVGAIKADS